MSVATSGGRKFGKHCPVCGNETASKPGLFGDRYCQACGSLADWIFGPILNQLRLAERRDLNAEEFLSDFSADSLDLLEMAMEYEDNHGVTIPDNDYDKLKTVDDVQNPRHRSRLKENADSSKRAARVSREDVRLWSQPGQAVPT